MDPPYKKPCKDLADKVAENVIEFLHGTDMARLRAYEEHFETNKARYPRQLCGTCLVPIREGIREMCINTNCKLLWCKRPYCVPPVFLTHACSTFSYVCSQKCADESRCIVNGCQELICDLCRQLCTMCLDVVCRNHIRVCDRFFNNGHDDDFRERSICVMCLDSMRRKGDNSSDSQEDDEN